VKVLFDVEISTILKEVTKMNQYRKHLYSPNAFFLETNPESVDSIMEKLFSDAAEIVCTFSLIPSDTIEDFVLSQSLPSSTSSMKKDFITANMSSIVTGIGKGINNLNLRKKRSIQQNSIPIAQVNMSDKNLIKFCTGCGWRFKYATDRFCGECGAVRKEK
jgi:hypothetical protein